MRLGRRGWRRSIIGEVGLGPNGVEKKVNEILRLYKNAEAEQPIIQKTGTHERGGW
jgi:hypothetical protein